MRRWLNPAVRHYFSTSFKVVFSSFRASSLRHYGSGYLHNRAAGLVALAFVYAPPFAGVICQNSMAQNPRAYGDIVKSRPSLLLGGLPSSPRASGRAGNVSLHLTNGKCRTNQRNRHILHYLRIALHQAQRTPRRL